MQKNNTQEVYAQENIHESSPYSGLSYSFDAGIAAKYGIHIAVIVNVLPRLQIMNRQQPEYFDNQSLEDILVGFMPYFTRKEIKTALEKMQTLGWFEGGQNG